MYPCPNVVMCKLPATRLTPTLPKILHADPASGPSAGFLFAVGLNPCVFCLTLSRGCSSFIQLPPLVLDMALGFVGGVSADGNEKSRLNKARRPDD